MACRKHWQFCTKGCVIDPLNNSHHWTISSCWHLQFSLCNQKDHHIHCLPSHCWLNSVTFCSVVSILSVLSCTCICILHEKFLIFQKWRRNFPWFSYFKLKAENEKKHRKTIFLFQNKNFFRYDDNLMVFRFLLRNCIMQSNL